MKQILYTLMAILAVITTSCSNDDISIETTGRLHTLTYTVSTQSMYDNFKISDAVREKLRDNSYSLGVKTYLYNSKGELVDSKSSYINTYNSITESFENIIEGEYTIISIETLFNPERGYIADAWEIADEDNLSTLKIIQRYTNVSYLSALGTCTSKISINEDLSLNVTPNGIGSILQLQFFNYDKSEFPQVAFGTNDVIESYLLNPSLGYEDRFVTSLTSTGVFNNRGSANVNDRQKFGMTIYILDYQINWKFYVKNPEDVGTSSWSYWPDETEGKTQLQDGGIYYGGSYYINDFYIPQCFIGNAQEYDNWLANIEQIVSEMNAPLVPDLYLTWGGDVLTAQSMMTQYKMTMGNYGEALLQEDGSYAIAYDGRGKVSQIIYNFTSPTTGLFEADVQYDKNSVTKDEVLNYLNGNYTYVYDMNDIYMYTTSDYSTIVMFFEIGGVYDIGFVDANYINGISAESGTRSGDSQVYQLMIDKVKQRMSKTSPKTNNHLYKISDKGNYKTVSETQSFLKIQ